MVIQQAQAAGIPVVATRVGDVARMVERSGSGLLVDPGDVSGLADAMFRVLSDQDLADKMGLAGRRRAECYRSEAVAARTVEVYREALKQPIG